MKGNNPSHQLGLQKRLLFARGGIAILLLMAILCLNVPAQAGQPADAHAPPVQDQPEEGNWVLVDSSTEHQWQGDNFHGLKSGYNPLIFGNTLGATYTQYKIQFKSDSPLTVETELTGTCTWNWEGGSIPGQVTAGKKYPFTLAVTAELSGTPMMATVDGFIKSNEGTHASAQAFLDMGSEQKTDDQEVNGSLALAAGQKEGETRNVVQTCKVDIVTVTATYVYQWRKAGCSARLSLPKDMTPGEEFSPQVSVSDPKGNAVQPEEESWFYNGEETSFPQKWDGKEGVLEYQYLCPNEREPRRAKINIPAANACQAVIFLPEMEPDKEFSPMVEVHDLEGEPVTPEKPKWYYNNAQASFPRKWDGKEASVSYEFNCPLDDKLVKVTKTIPAAPEASVEVVVGDENKVAAAAIAIAAAAGALAIAGAAGIGIIAAVRSQGGKDKKQVKYILQVDKNYLEIKHKETVYLNIKAWRVETSGATSPVPEAVIRVTLPAASAGLAAEPVSGKGELRCAFSLPAPSVCADVPVTVSAAIGKAKTSTNVTVRILPLYTLTLHWADPQNHKIVLDGKEVFARAELTAVPKPDAKTTPETLAAKIKIEVEGPNKHLVKLETTSASQKPYVRDGALWIPVRAISAPKGASPETGNPNLVAKFEEGKQRLKETLALSVNDNLALEARVDQARQKDVVFIKDQVQPAWGFGTMSVYFREMGDNPSPAAAPFEYKLSFQFDPPVLEARELPMLDQITHTFDVRLQEGVNLEEHFGKHLAGRSGTIHAQVIARAKSGKEFFGAVSFRLRPQLELFTQPVQQGPRSYQGVSLKAGEFVTDGDDQYEIILGCCRTDQPGPRDVEQIEQVDPAWWSFEPELDGDESSDFEVLVPEDKEGFERTLQVKPRRVLLYRDTGVEEKLILRIKGAVTAQMPGNYLHTIAPCKANIRPRYPNLRLWVVPGKKRGTSEAWMLVFLDRNTRDTLQGAALNIYTEDFFGSSGVSLQPALNEELPYRTDQNGSAQATLLYSGLNWKTCGEAKLVMSCTLLAETAGKESEPVKAAVNIGENLRQMLTALLARADMLQLNNPHYQLRSWAYALTDISALRPIVRGPLWNFMCTLFGHDRAYVAKRDMKSKFSHDYVCSEFRDRIGSWLVRRRHYKAGSPDEIEQVCSMNGIEFDSFMCGSGLHNYAAIFLAGMAPEEDPYGLDPWWKQHWKDPAYASPEGLITKFWEREYCLETAAWLTVSTIPLVALAVKSGGGTVVLISEMLIPLIDAYEAATAGELAPEFERMYTDGGGYIMKNAEPYTGRDVFIRDWLAAHPNG